MVMVERYKERVMEAATEVLALAKAQKQTLVTVESCTSGLLAAVLSEAPNPSTQLHGGFVTYTKENKTAAPGVSPKILSAKGAVCEDVARAMAEGALERSPADGAVSITGGAGPDRDADGNPVGLVFIAIARRGFRRSTSTNNMGILDASRFASAP
jgi:nicotinamide-nucleotide amidase